MNRTVRYSLGALASTSLLAFTAGCGTGSEDEGPRTLVFWHSSEGASAEYIDKVVADFNAENKGEITVKAAYQGSYDDTVAKLRSSVQSGDLPDVVQINDANTSFMVATGLAQPLDEVVAETDVPYDFDEVVPAVANYYKVNGHFWSMPFQASQPAVAINPELIKRAGLDPAAAPSDLAGLVKWADQIHAKTGKAGLTMHLNSWWFEELSGGAGIVYCTPENGLGSDKVEAFTLTDPTQIAQWTALQDLFKSKAALNVGTEFDAAVNAFASGEVAMMFTSSGALGTIEDAASGRYEIIPFPVQGSEGGAVPGGNSVWIVSPEKEKSEAAAQFLAYLGSDEVQQDGFAETGYLPTTETPQTTAQADATPAQQVLLKQLAATPATTASAGCHSGAMQGVREELDTAIEQIAGGEPVAAALADVENQASKIVADYNERAGQ